MRELCSPSLPENHKDLIAYVSAAISYELSLSNICVPFSKVATLQAFNLNKTLAEAMVSSLPDIDKWETIIKASGVFSDGSTLAPLVYDTERLYIYRYWKLEQNVANKLESMSQPTELSAAQTKLAKAVLDKLFSRNYDLLWEMLGKNDEKKWFDVVIDFMDVQPQFLGTVDETEVRKVVADANSASDLIPFDAVIPDSLCLNWQKVAAATSITRKLSVISGGPGTGKTTTVSKLLAALSEIHDKEDMVIKLCAPTGKAAARLTESITQAMQSLPVSEEVKSLIPTEASTIHRLLGAVYKKADFRHNADNQLHLDVLVIDEASMIDLVLISKLLDAIPDHAIVIFLGDKDQLASVEAGSVLGDICGFIRDGFSSKQSALLNKITGFELAVSEDGNHFTDSLCMLKKSYRFHKNSGIGQLAYATNSGKASRVHNVLSSGYSDIDYVDLDEQSYHNMIKEVAESYSEYLIAVKNGNQEEALKAFSNTRLLCATREGDCGIQTLNQKVESALNSRNLISPSETSAWYEGRPIMVSKNDHSLGLYNGDIGICMRDEDGVLYVYFESSESGLRRFLPSRLPDHETNYAMTIHKSQGSEFANTFMLLPDKLSPVLTRELIYTGITRAKTRLKLCGVQDILNGGVSIKTKSDSGLVYLLSQL
jgi:exodeoxyribonuclease V alpha subunit